MERDRSRTKVFIVYDTKYGNTRIVAEEIAKGLREVEGIEVHVEDVERLRPESVADSDAILIGSPNHLGGPARTIKKFIDRLGEIELRASWFAAFDTYLARKDFEKAVRKIEKRVEERIPRLKQIAPGLSIRVKGIKGPIAENELLRCREFGRRLGSRLQP